MTLKLYDQARIVETDGGFAMQIDAACFAAAVTAFGAAPLADPTKQAQRMGLVSQIFANVHAQYSIFAWVCVSQASLNTAADLTDAFITTTCTGFFDVISQQVIPK